MMRLTLATIMPISAMVVMARVVILLMLQPLPDDAEVKGGALQEGCAGTSGVIWRNPPPVLHSVGSLPSRPAPRKRR